LITEPRISTNPCGSEPAREGCFSGGGVLPDCVNIHSWGNGGLGFRPYGGSPFPNAEKVTQKACPSVRPARWGSGFLRSGIHPGASPPVCFAAPPLDAFGCAKRSLRSHPRINPSTQPADGACESRSRAGELTLGLMANTATVGVSLLAMAICQALVLRLDVHKTCRSRACSRRRQHIQHQL
jgi:hypothetical protein